VDGIVAVSFEGEFDLANAPAVQDRVDDVLASGEDMIFDLSEATFIDSSVVNVLMGAARVTRGETRKLVLQLGTAAVVERILEIAGIESVMPRARERQEAVRIIQGQAAATV
jgi:anti-anti-sigma factor